MTGGSGLTVDDVADFAEDLRFELLDGDVFRRSSPLPVHQWHVWRTVAALDRHAPEDCLVSYGQPVLVDPFNLPFVDVVVIRAEAGFDSPVPARDVLVAVEVLSPWSQAVDRGPKKWLYARAGIPAYWLVDPCAERVAVTQFRLGRTGRYSRRLHATDRVEVDEPWRATLDLPAWTRRRDQLRAKARAGGQPSR